MIDKNIEAACTIVSKNYIAYARTLCESYLKYHPNNEFFVLLVDRNNGEIDSDKELFNLIEVENLEIENFDKIAFTFDVLELNTNVKPSFIQYLFNKYDFEKIIYLDPDILVFQPLTTIYSLLDKNDIILTPHCITPIDEDDYKPSEQNFLLSGVFNLGFIALKNTIESHKMLKWWEKRCLNLGFNEAQTGLFVDQKWMNLCPCLFENVYILKNLGCNMAYWNLHERTLSKIDLNWIVNNKDLLLFFHFSGININQQKEISKYQNRYTFDLREDLQCIFKEYFNLLINNGIENTSNYEYAFGSYSNGEKITSFARRIFSVKKQNFSINESPFSIESQFYKWAKSRKLLSTVDNSRKYNSSNYKKTDWRIRLLNGSLKVILNLFGANKYSMLMKYLGYISVLRNQKDLFD